VASKELITREVLEGYLNCVFKAHLLVRGECEIVTEYEALMLTYRQELVDKVTHKFRSKGKTAIIHGSDLNDETLNSGAAFILDTTYRDDKYAVRIDGLKQIDNHGGLGHYVPVVFSKTSKITKTQRQMLEVFAVLIARVQKTAPTFGLIYHGIDCTASTVKFASGLKPAEEVLTSLERLITADAEPRFLLNDHCHICQFQQRCKDKAKEEDSLSLIQSIGEKELKAYARKGLFTLTQLAHTFRPRRKGSRVGIPRPHRYHALQALAIRDRKVYVLGEPAIPVSTVEIFLDLEGDPYEEYIYLIGIVILDGDLETRYSLWADSGEQEREIFAQFTSIVTKYDAPRIFCYGGYEKAFIKRMRRQARRKAPVDKILTSLVNVLSLIYSYYYFPTYSNGLKEIGSYLGFAWSSSDASGIQSIVWRSRWKQSHLDIWKSKLVEYNLDDCMALKKVTAFLRAARDGTSSGNSSVARVQELDKLAQIQKWGKVDFRNDDFNFVNKCSYFDYQRQRVYIRTSKTIKKHARLPGSQRNRKLHPNKEIEITALKCPFCGDQNITYLPIGQRQKYVDTRVRQLFDLIMTPGGIKRKIIECKAAAYHCENCGKYFISPRYHRISKFNHGLMSWAMYQHVAQHQSCDKLSILLYEFFGLTVHSPEIYSFRFLLTQYYRVTYRRLLEKLISGKVLHVDETEVKLRTGKAYVWVFASSEEAIYIYKPTREGAFLTKMLKDFKGVLISDFYAAYDSLECPQQKCLIHLIRDMNQETLNNPFDVELQEMVQPFGTLLRTIVEKIDEFGLKHGYLRSFEGEVIKFFRDIEEKSFDSDSAQSMQARLLKYKNKLFTFIQYDGVSWNNNNAENAIKQFAYYRENTVGLMKEEGLTCYLALLSIYQTCRYRGVSFLKFLLSKERDVDKFSARKSMAQSRSDVEFYPKGYVPPQSGRVRSRSAEDPPEGEKVQ
jgi:predicted RecB family nuclease